MAGWLDGWMAGSWQAVVCALLCRILFTPSAHLEAKILPTPRENHAAFLKPPFLP